MPEVTVDRAGPERARALSNLLQLYVHDFSEWSQSEAWAVIGEDGRFPPVPLEPFFRQPDRSAHLIRADGELAGFALIDAQGHSGARVDFNMAEFFVMRKHRRTGVGRAAAAALIAERPGVWEIALVRKNLGAQPFWRGVAARAAAGEVEELDLADARWNGVILRFRAG